MRVKHPLTEAPVVPDASRLAPAGLTQPVSGTLFHPSIVSSNTMSNLNSLRETLARKQAEVASLEQELSAAQAAQFTELPAKLGLDSIDAVIKALAAYASPRLKGALAKAFGGKLPATSVLREAPAKEKSAPPSAKPERRKRVTVTPELKDAVIQALQAGKTTSAVAEECGVSPATVNNIKRAAGLTKPREQA